MALLEVGRIVRPHGLTGEVVVALSTNVLERVAPGNSLHAEIPSTGARELEITSSRPHQGRYLVRFAGVANRDAAEALRDGLLLAEAIEGSEELFVHELIGAELIDQDGRSHGIVKGVEANPASDLLVVEDGYVPMTFVRDFSEGTVTVEIPEGLLG